MPSSYCIGWSTALLLSDGTYEVDSSTLRALMLTYYDFRREYNAGDFPGEPERARYRLKGSLTFLTGREALRPRLLAGG